MSRAFRIQVNETLSKVLRAEDHVSTQLEMLDVLPCEQMSELLATELEKLGFQRDGNTMSQDRDGTVVEIDLESATVVVRRESEKEINISKQQTGRAYDDEGPSQGKIKEGLRRQAKKELAEIADEKNNQLQSKVTDELEAELGDIRRELDRAVNAATAEALKQKAAQIGTIKELTEDPQTGSLTIVVDV